MPPSEVEKIFQAFAEKRKAELPRFTPDGIPITMENKFDDAIYNYLYAYWKEQSGEYDPKKDVIPESEMNKMHPKTKNEFQFEKWLLQQYGMTKKEERGYTLEGNLESLWEIFSAADMVLFAQGLPSIGKELAQLGKKAVDDVAEEAIEKTVKKEAAEEMAESTAKKDMAYTTEDLSKETVKKEDVLKSSSVIKGETGTLQDMGDTFDDWLKRMSTEDRDRYLKNLDEIADRQGLSMNDYYKSIEDNFYYKRIINNYYDVLEPSLPTGSKPVGIYDQRNLPSVLRQNESADFLADKGYNVKMLDEVPGGNGYGIKPDSNPDFYIENTVFDCYTPDTNKSKNVIKELYNKTKKQSTHIVLNLDDYAGDAIKLLEEISRKATPNSDLKRLEELWVIKDNTLTKYIFH